MKRFLLLTLVFTAALHAQTAKPKQNEVDNLSPALREFYNLPEEKRIEFIRLYEEAKKYLEAYRVFETLDTLNQAEKIFSNSVQLYNLRGSCYVEMRIFDQAEIAFKRAQELNPSELNVMFNVAECFFVTKRWQASHDKFQELLKLMPPSEMGLARLIEFKILLCKKKLGMDKEAAIMLDKYDYQDDSPYHYYAKAVAAFDRKDNAEAEQWMARAARIFRDPKIIRSWQDTMMEYGYIKGFYGGDEEFKEAVEIP